MISQVDDDEAGSRILLIPRWAEGERRGLPVGVRAEVTNHLTEGLGAVREHVVAVDLSRKNHPVRCLELSSYGEFQLF